MDVVQGTDMMQLDWIEGEGWAIDLVIICAKLKSTQ